MEVEIGIGKSGRRAYGFDDIAIVPSRRTRDPEDVDISWEVDAFKFELPLIASAMDGVVSPKTAIEIGRLGGLACLNLEGLWTRYEDTDSVFDEIAGARPREGDPPDAGALPGADQGRAHRRAHPRDQGRRRARRPRRSRPQRVEQYCAAVLEAELDLLVVQGTVVSAEHVSKDPARQPLNLKKFIREFEIPVIVGGLRVATARRCTSCAPARSASSSASARATPAPRAACSASASRRPPRSPMPPAPGSATSTRPACTSTSSPTAGCAPAATSPRRSPAAPTR